MMWGLFHEIFEKLVANYFSKKFRKAITTWGGDLKKFLKFFCRRMILKSNFCELIGWGGNCCENLKEVLWWYLLMCIIFIYRRSKYFKMSNLGLFILQVLTFKNSFTSQIVLHRAFFKNKNLNILTFIKHTRHTIITFKILLIWSSFQIIIFFS